LGDLAVGQAFTDKSQNLPLLARQIGKRIAFVAEALAAVDA
jgi:hypothetical protein